MWTTLFCLCEQDYCATSSSTTLDKSRPVKVNDIMQVKIYLIHKPISGIKIDDTTAKIIAIVANSLERFASYSEADIE